MQQETRFLDTGCPALLLGGIGLALLLGSCATPPGTRLPAWASPGGIAAVFPEAEYIAQEGRGNSREEADAQGAAQIALFFNTRLHTMVTLEQERRETEESVHRRTDMETKILIWSDMQVARIRYTQDAYYDRDSRTWHTVAYIRRAEAWEVYEPRFRQQAGAFHQLFQAGEQEGDPFKKALGYLAAQRYGQGGDFEQAVDFGQGLYPGKMQELFGELWQERAALPRRLAEAKGNAKVYIECPRDFESLIHLAVGEAFRRQGFPLAEARSGAAAVCTVRVDEGEEQRDLGIFYHPNLQGTVTGSSGALLNFSAQGERTAAVSPELAKRRAYTALADKVQEALAASFSLPLP